MQHRMNLTPDPFNRIKTGSKTIELRLYDEKRRLISVGDTIEFVNTNDVDDRITVKVARLHVFENFETLYRSLPLQKCGYAASELKSAKASDMNAYYPIEQQKQYSVVGIEIELI